jgi:Helix-turn-helix domain
MEGMESRGLGTWLAEHRRQSGRSLAELAARTRIRQFYLQALEEENFDQIPGEAYLLGFLRLYADALGLSPAEALARYRRLEIPGSPAVEPVPEQVPLPRHKSPKWQRFGLLATVLILAAVGLVLATFRPEEKAESPLANAQRSPSRGAAADVAQPEPALSPAVAPPGPVAGQRAASLPAPDALPPPAAGTSQATGEKKVLPLPAGGGILKVEALTPCRVKVAVDELPRRDYRLLPGTVVKWPVTNTLRLSMVEPGRLPCWLNDRPPMLLVRQELVLQSPGGND